MECVFFVIFSAYIIQQVGCDPSGFKSKFFIPDRNLSYGEKTFRLFKIVFQL